jgi:DNA-binding MarR family transcriptional regulator
LQTTQIEQQLTILLRRTQRIHFRTTAGEVDLDRSAYGILCRLADEGPQRVGSLAQAFGLDPSTITRQVQALESAAMVMRQSDPTDRRASIVDLTPEGAEALAESRERRRARLQEALADWSQDDLAAFGRLLERFNLSIDDLAHRHASEPEPASG